MYSERVLDHFREPHNQGRLERYSAIGKVGNVVCGDVMWMYILVEPSAEGDEEIISDISWETFGCTAAIATSSMVSDLAKGKTLDEAIGITNERVAEELGGLPKPKMHCSALAADALNEAIYEYFKSTDRPIPDRLRQRHERILRHREEVEKRYEAFRGGDHDGGSEASAGGEGSACA
jgi:nitrogen fixation NifU-like protein